MRRFIAQPHGPANWGPLLVGRLRRQGNIQGPLGSYTTDVDLEALRRYAEFMDKRRAARLR